MSNYKGYKLEDNLKRKSNNIDLIEQLSGNNNVKCYSTKPGQLSAKSQAVMQERYYKKLNKKQLVKHYNFKCPIVRLAFELKIIS